MPEAWEAILKEIENVGSDQNRREALVLRMQIALMTTQANVDLYVEDQSASRAKAALDASAAHAKAAETTAKSLTRATWVLAGATVALIIATIGGAVIASN
jgi:predicted house-cleaning NTP pyrophosphatase (Maf/HAM1 superfamily)